MADAQKALLTEPRRLFWQTPKIYVCVLFARLFADPLLFHSPPSSGRPRPRPALVTAVILFDPLISRRPASTYFLSGRCPHKSYSRSTPAHHRSPDSRPWKISDSLLLWIYRRPPFVIVQRWNLKTPILAFDSLYERDGVRLLVSSIFPECFQACLGICKMRIVFLKLTRGKSGDSYRGCIFYTFSTLSFTN